jgi:putative tricarboxylic transport membrane protein
VPPCFPRQLTGLIALLLLGTACAPAAQPSPTAAPAKPATTPAAAASPAAASPSPSPSPAASPAGAASPVASPAAAASPSPAAPVAQASKPVAASTWRPERPIEMVVQAAAGGGSDILARTVADILNKERIVEQPIAVVNKPGGSGAIAYSYLNEKQGDPHFIATVTASYLTTPIQGQSPVTYRDFSNYAVLAVDDFIAVVRSNAPYSSLKELVDAAKAAPNSIRVGTTQIGSSDSIIEYLLEKELNAVSFNSAGEVNAALLGGAVDLAFANPGEVRELIRAGRLKQLAVFAPDRLADFGDLPTAKELGYNVTVEQFRGVIGPGGVTPDQALYWQNALQRMTETAPWKEYLEKNTLRPLVLTGPEAEQYIARESAQLTEVLRALGLAS